jgi:hypothetical protein
MNTIESNSAERANPEYSGNIMRHQYRVLTDAEKANMQKVKDLGLDFYALLHNIGNSRELSLAKTKCEEAVMWAVKHITG